ncbi:MAG: septum formation initiator family protein [Luminiphilus sp.]|uniref:Cell division protein FtsB n=1 Tax=Candidatus Paraluminiphilus aquimaris TaxID=2518994 RepID=A0ABY6Q7K5_9GAMM|nr:septum formation initiator family protein [Candidatus Paraluminiphilus aquimaris]MAJ53737.1 cell division protein FtsB [Halieaceae bacterium]MCH1459932.1 septum formation initiator family protein [Luminiphilus sp.]OUU99657.1 MAG: cell division protein FtsB [Cellvibrionales bacterium TMED79]UZP74647.1 septum formation initiator family protein [Candidatus Paraluminiphilus aquimaris]
MPRALLLVLLGLLALLQYQLWLGDGGISERRSLESQVASDSKENQSLRQRNEALADRVIELQEGDEMLEAVAREDLGLVREGEEFILFVDDKSGEKSP